MRFGFMARSLCVFVALAPPLVYFLYSSGLGLVDSEDSCTDESERIRSNRGGRSAA